MRHAREIRDLVSFLYPTGPRPMGNGLKGSKITIFENLQNVQKSSKMAEDLKIAHFDPGSDGICLFVCLSQNF